MAKKLSDFRPQAINANKHTQRGRGLLQNSMQRDGYSAPMIAAEDGEIFIGSHRLEVAGEVFSPDVEPIIVESDGTRPVIVKRTDIKSANDPKARRLGLADNRIAQISLEWDVPVLQTFDLPDLDVVGFNENERVEFGIEEPKHANAEPQIDRAEELQEKWQVQTGDLWQIGDHRLICGDCTDADVVARVMGGEKAGACVTDSPYGINREGIENDSPEGLRELFDGCLAAMPIENAVVINFQSPRLFWVWVFAVIEAGHKIERELWLDKINDETFPWRGWILTSESIILSSVGNPLWLDVRPYVHDTYRYTGIGHELPKEWGKVHATVKPLEVVQDLVSRIGGDVYDPFLGSGTTLVACQNLGRRGRGIEIAPKYCAVTLERMSQAFPELEIERID